MTGSSSAYTSRTETFVERRPFRLSWGAVFAGLLVAMMVQLLLTVLGAAIGLATWGPGSGKALGIGAGIWTLLTMLISLFIGGATAGWVAGTMSRNAGMLHGILVWSLTTLFTLWMVSRGVGAITGATFGLVGNVVGATAGAAAHGATSAITNTIQGGTGDIRGEIETLLRQTGNPALQPESLRAASRRAGNTVTQSPASNQDVANEIITMIQNRASTLSREDVVNVIMARTGRSRAEAERIADRVIALQQSASAKVDTLQHQVAQQAENVASATSKGLWITLVGMILSLAAAAWGASWATGREARA